MLVTIYLTTRRQIPEYSLPREPEICYMLETLLRDDFISWHGTVNKTALSSSVTVHIYVEFSHAQVWVYIPCLTCDCSGHCGRRFDAVVSLCGQGADCHLVLCWSPGLSASGPHIKPRLSPPYFKSCYLTIHTVSQ
jgi:hypothetical protein